MSKQPPLANQWPYPEFDNTLTVVYIDLLSLSYYKKFFSEIFPSERSDGSRAPNGGDAARARTVSLPLAAHDAAHSDAAHDAPPLLLRFHLWQLSP